jgi:uncharacterized membrane protein
MDNRGSTSFGTVIAVIGAVLIALGFAWIIAQNWHQMNAFVKIFILAILVTGCYTTAVVLRKKEYSGTANAFLVLGALLYTLSIFLIAQIFSTDSSIQGFAMLLLIAWIGVITTAYVFNSRSTLVIGLLEMLLWLFLQYLAFSIHADSLVGLVVLLFLAGGVLFFGLSLIHHAFDHPFTMTYRGFTALYFLILTYLLTFQFLLPYMWNGELTSMSSVIFLIFIIILSVIALFVGIFLIGNKLNRTEFIMLITMLVLILSVIGASVLIRNSVGYCEQKSCYDFRTVNACNSAPANMNCEWQRDYCMQKECYSITSQSECQSSPLHCKWDYNSCSAQSCYDQTTQQNCSIIPNCAWNAQSNTCAYGYYGQSSACSALQYDTCSQDNSCKWTPGSSWWGSQSRPGSFWAVWIYANVVFILLVLTVLFYATRNNMPGLVNLGIGFFILFVITRYIGFIIDFGGYLGLALIFISGGILLVLGGFLIERWRRKLVEQAKK